jgi:ABC-type ATPase with predicted acetyltransferase domain
MYLQAIDVLHEETAFAVSEYFPARLPTTTHPVCCSCRADEPHYFSLSGSIPQERFMHLLQNGVSSL